MFQPRLGQFHSLQLDVKEKYSGAAQSLPPGSRINLEAFQGVVGMKDFHSCRFLPQQPVSSWMKWIVRGKDQESYLLVPLLHSFEVFMPGQYSKLIFTLGELLWGLAKHTIYLHGCSGPLGLL